MDYLAISFILILNKKCHHLMTIWELKEKNQKIWSCVYEKKSENLPNASYNLKIIKQSMYYVFLHIPIFMWLTVWVYGNRDVRCKIAFYLVVMLRGVFKFRNSIANLAKAFKSESQELLHYRNDAFCLLLLMPNPSEIFKYKIWKVRKRILYTFEYLQIKNVKLNTTNLIYVIIREEILSYFKYKYCIYRFYIFFRDKVLVYFKDKLI